MKLTEFSIHHATAVFVLIAVIVIGGIRSYNNLPKEAAPDVQIPIVIVSTAYFGVSPADIETLITREMEQELNSLRDVDKMTSTSAESVSLITLEFDPEIDIDSALQKVREKVDKAESELPDDAEDPEIIEINASDFPIMIANVSGDLEPVRLKSIGEDLQEDIESIKGVLRVELAGGVEREIQVRVDPKALRHHKVSLNQIIGAIQSENVNLPGGSIDVGPSKYTVRVPAEFDRAHELEEIVVKQSDGQPIFLRDVAEVGAGFDERDTYSRLTTWEETEEGDRRTVTRPNVSLSVVKRAGENILRIAKEAKEVIGEYEKRFSEADLDIVVLNDNSEMIKSQVHDLENKLISGLLLVVIVLFFFMGGFRNALFVGISIPLSMLISFLVLRMMGVTLNMVVLFSLVLALGMLVDNAIVVVENIYRHATEGKDRVTAAIDGTTEVGWAIIASTATTVGAFFPLLFWPGIMGEFMGYLPLTVIIVLLSSLFVALVINPTICAKFIKADPDEEYDEAEVPDIAIYRVYRRLLNVALNNRVLVLLLSIAVLAGSIWMFVRADQGVELFPSTTPDKFNVQVEMPDGTRLEATDEVVEELEKPLDRRPELVEAWVAEIGTQGGGRAAGGGEAPHYGSISVDLVDVEDQTSSSDNFIKELRSTYDDVAGANITVEKAEMGPPTGAPVSIEISGPELATLQKVARRVKDEIRSIPGLIDLKDDLELTRPEVHVLVDRQQAAMADVDTRQIAQTVRTAISGTTASTIRDEDEEHDITVRLTESAREDIRDLETLTIANKDNFHIPLAELATIDVRGGSGSIHHKDEERVVTVTAKPAEGYLATNLLDKARKRLEPLDFPAGYNIRYTGESEDRKEASDFLSGALLAALFIIALILVTEFNSVLQPLIILLSVLLSLIGVFLSLLATGEPFGIIMTGIGIISLAGVVVNNSIVLVDYINILRERGYDRRDAVVQGGLVRFRPVMLTAFTTALGLIPIVIGVSLDFINTRIVVGGTSVEMWGPMSRVVTAGLMVATVLTLIVVPVLYSTFDDVSKVPGRIAGKLGASSLALLLVMGSSPLLAQSPPNQEKKQREESKTADQPKDEESPEKETDVAGESAGGAETEPSKPAERESDLEAERKKTDVEAIVDENIDASRTLTLTDAQTRVREKNFDVKIAATRIEEAASQIRRAYAIVLPDLTASGTYTINDREVTAEVGGDNLPPGADAPEFVVQPKTDYRWQVAASVNFDARALPLIHQANTQKDLAEIQVDALRDELEFAVTQSYYNLLTLRRVIQLSAEQLKTSRTMLRATEKRVAAGAASQFELTRAKLRVVQAEKRLERSRLQFTRARESVAELMQVEADFDVVTPDDPQDPESPTRLIEQAADNRLQVDVRKLQTEIADQSIKEIFAAYLPTLGATFSILGSKTTDFNPDEFKWQLSFNARWVLWDGGGREAQIDQRQAQRLAAKLEKRQLLSEIESDIREAWAQYESARSQVDSGESEVELARKTLEQSRIAYRHGAASQLDVINAEDQLRTAEITLVQDRLNLELAVRRLRYLAGID